MPLPADADRQTDSVAALARTDAVKLPLAPAGTGYIRCEDLRRIVHNLGRSLAYRSVKELVASVAEALAASTTSSGSRHKADRVYYRQLLPEHVKQDKVGLHCNHAPLDIDMGTGSCMGTSCRRRQVCSHGGHLLRPVAGIRGTDRGVCQHRVDDAVAYRRPAVS